MKIRLNLSHAIHNKPADPTAPAVRNALGYSFKPAQVTPEELTAHITSGKAWSPHAFKTNRRKGEFWVSAQVLALDLDNEAKDPTQTTEAIAANPFIRANAYLVYPTPSSTVEQPKNRVLFILSEAVTDRDGWQLYQRVLFEHLDLKPDKKCKDLARLFYGSDKPGFIVLGNVLPLETVEALAAPIREQDRQKAEQAEQRHQNYQRVDPNSSRAEKYAAAAFEKALRELESTPAGNRNHVIFKISARLMGWALGGWPGITSSRIESAIEGIFSRWDNPGKSRATMHNGFKAATATPLELPPEPAHKKRNQRRQYTQTHQRSTQTVDDQPAEGDFITANYVSDVLTPEAIAREKTLLIAAPVGMGKTTAISSYAQSLPPETMLTGYAQYRLLTSALSKALDASHYEDSTGQYQQSLKHSTRLVTSVTSAPKFGERNGGIVIADEIEGDLHFILSSSTFRDSGARESWHAFKQAIIQAEQFIGMDAGLSDITIDLIRQWRGDATVKRFRKAESRGNAILLNSPTAAIYQIGKMLLHKRGPVTVACSSEAKTTDIADHFTEKGYRAKKVTRDTSSTEDTRRYATEASAREGFDSLVYDAAMGAGVSIDEGVYAHIAIFDSKPLDPEHAIQLLGRVRHPKRIYIACPPDSEGYATPTEAELISERLRREYVTAEMTGRDANVDGDYLEMLQVWAKFEARSRRESAQWRRYFIERLKANGYSVSSMYIREPEAFKATWDSWKEQRADADWRYVLEQAKDNTLDDDTLRKLRQQAEITREMNLRHKRHHIEKVLGHADVTANDRDLMKPADCQKLVFLTAIKSGIRAALALDKEQAQEGRPIQHREYLTVRLKTYSHILEAMGFTASTLDEQLTHLADYFNQERSAGELAERFTVLGTDKLTAQFKRLGHNGTNAETITGLIRWLLDRAGYKLLSAKRGGRENRHQCYWIDPERRCYLDQRAARAAEKRVQNIHNEGKYVWDTDFAAAQPQAHPSTVKPPFVNKAPPVWKKDTNPNPFAAGWKSAGAAS